MSTYKNVNIRPNFEWSEARKEKARLTTKMQAEDIHMTIGNIFHFFFFELGLLVGTGFMKFEDLEGEDDPKVVVTIRRAKRIVT